MRKSALFRSAFEKNDTPLKFSFVMDVQRVCGKKFQKSIFCGSNSLEVVKEMYNKCNVDEFELLVDILRRIWFRRNIVVH